VTGLTKGSGVQYNGIPVGRVVDIRVDPDNVGKIQATVEIDASIVDIKSDARARLETNILSGVSAVQITGGTQGAGTLEPQPGHRYAVILTESSTIEQLTAAAPQVVAAIKEAVDSLNRLLSDENRAAVTESLENVRILTSRLADRSEELKGVLADADSAIGQAKSLVHDIDQSYVEPGGLKDKLAQTLVDADQLAKNLGDTNRQLQQVLEENRPGIRDFSQHTLTQVNELLTETRQFIAGLTRISDQIGRDPGRFLFGDRREGYRPR